MAMIKWTPFYEPMVDLERFFGEGMLRTNFNPAVDMYEQGDSIVVEVALAGIDPKNVKINIEDSVLSIEGSNERKSEVDEANYYRKEVRSGSFHRLISLPSSVNMDQTKAEYDKGILKITMPKQEEQKAKPITIQINEKQ